ncbi:glycoside hydrolase family 2 TIM barrel-domain containing protein [Lutibacter citreus]|uniref:glycoside hydrolase family 2 TIM barrel-domain containing protein n=1 Tax=Lutibacter citreus TaxID=2138210 RepID=UPI000DBE7DEB|nr:glycoside hydrolase family 2 TIM barrel-domain containing protein [Lutibacter citreus]
MRNSINKNIYRGILILTFVAVNAFILYGASSVLGYLKTGADRSTMLHTEIKSVDIYLPKTTWSSLDNPGRPISDEALNSIEDNYLKSWYITNIAYATNDPYGIEDFYTDSARVHIYETIKLNKKEHITIESTTLNHEPKLDFYSEDGTLAVISDDNVIEHQKTYKNKELIFTETDTSSYQLLLLLEDGFWRIRHKIKKPNPSNIASEKTTPFAYIQGSNIIVNNIPFITKGINYYPQNTPWNMFGENFDIHVIEKDLKIIKDSKLNSIRIFLQYEDFGKAHVPYNKIEKLKMVLDTAEKLDLKVVVTLFDFYGDYSLMNWTLTHRHAEQIVSFFKNHKAILAWDIKNEPDLDFESRNKEVVCSWLNQMIVEVKKFDPNHLITIGWSSPEVAVNLATKVDFVSYHYYKQIENFSSDIKLLKQNTFGKPLVLQEFGLSSYNGVWNAFRGGETQQANYHKKMQENLKKDSLAFMSWSLYDFKSIPTSVAGILPWRKTKQKYFGFINENGDEKPSFSYITY